jgi:hypothetical protein
MEGGHGPSSKRKKESTCWRKCSRVTWVRLSSETKNPYGWRRGAEGERLGLIESENSCQGQTTKRAHWGPHLTTGRCDWWGTLAPKTKDYQFPRETPITDNAMRSSGFQLRGLRERDQLGGLSNPRWCLLECDWKIAHPSGPTGLDYGTTSTAAGIWPVSVTCLVLWYSWIDFSAPPGQ